MRGRSRFDPVRLFPYLSALRPYLFRYRGEFLKGYLCILAQSGASLATPWLLRRGIQDIQAGGRASDLVGVAAGILALSAVSGVFLFLKRWVLIGASRLVEYDLRRDFFDHLLRLSLSFYHRNRTGDLMARATNDLNAVRDVVGPGLMYGLTTRHRGPGFHGSHAPPRPDPGRGHAGALSAHGHRGLRFAQEVHRRSLRVQDQYGELSNAAQENIAGIRVVQSYGQEEAEKASFRPRGTEPTSTPTWR